MLREGKEMRKLWLGLVALSLVLVMGAIGYWGYWIWHRENHQRAFDNCIKLCDALGDKSFVCEQCLELFGQIPGSPDLSDSDEDLQE